MATYKVTYLKTPKPDSEKEWEMDDEWELVAVAPSERDLGLLTLIWKKLEPETEEPETTGGLA